MEKSKKIHSCGNETLNNVFLSTSVGRSLIDDDEDDDDGVVDDVEDADEDDDKGAEIMTGDGDNDYNDNDGPPQALATTL